jgi:hypothetical protein
MDGPADVVPHPCSLSKFIQSQWIDSILNSIDRDVDSFIPIGCVATMRRQELVSAPIVWERSRGGA